MLAGAAQVLRRCATGGDDDFSEPAGPADADRNRGHRAQTAALAAVGGEELNTNLRPRRDIHTSPPRSLRAIVRSPASAYSRRKSKPTEDAMRAGRAWFSWVLF